MSTVPDPRIPARLAATQAANQQGKAHLKAQLQAANIYIASLQVTLNISIHPFLPIPAAASFYVSSPALDATQLRRGTDTAAASAAPLRPLSSPAPEIRRDSTEASPCGIPSVRACSCRVCSERTLAAQIQPVGVLVSAMVYVAC